MHKKRTVVLQDCLLLLVLSQAPRQQHGVLGYSVLAQSMGHDKMQSTRLSSEKNASLNEWTS